MKCWLLMLVFCIVGVVFGQPGPEIEWTYTYGGSGKDGAHCVRQTSDGGYILAGMTGSFPVKENRFYLVKTNAVGDTIWTKTYRSGEGIDVGNLECGMFCTVRSVQQTRDGGYIMAGHFSTNKEDDDTYIMKTDSAGSIQWTRSHHVRGLDQCQEVQQTDDGGYIVAVSAHPMGVSDGDFYLVRLDGDGKPQWKRAYDNNGYEFIYSVQQISDGGFIMAGSTQPFSSNVFEPEDKDILLVRANSVGDTVWSRTYNVGEYEYARSVRQTGEGDFVVVGCTSLPGDEKSDIVLLRVNAEGKLRWTRTYGGEGNDMGASVCVVSGGKYVICGTTDSYGSGHDDVYVIGVDMLGTVSWEKVIGGERFDSGHCIQETKDGGFVVAGITSSFGAGDWDMYLIKLGSVK